MSRRLLQSPGDDRQQREHQDFEELCGHLPDDLKQDFIVLWNEYAAATTNEAKLAKAFDKLETMLQHQLMSGVDTEFHQFNLTYGRDRTDAFALTRQIRDRVDDETDRILKSLSSNTDPTSVSE